MRSGNVHSAAAGRVVQQNLDVLEPRVLLAAVAAQWSDAFVDTIGINTHFGNTGGIYANSALPDLLNDLNVRHIRDNAKTDDGFDRLESFAAFGVDTLLVVDNTTISVAARVAIMQNAWASAIEGLNEPDFNPRDYAGAEDETVPVNSFLGTMAYQHALYEALNANVATRDKPILSPAMAHPRFTPTLGVGGGAMPFDLIAGHAYANGELPSRGSLDYEQLDALRILSPTPADNRSTWITETGYHNVTGKGDSLWQQGVSEAATAKYIPRLLAEYFNRGIPRTYLYELADQGTSTTDQEQRWGLLRNDLSPKPAYTALQNLIHLLDDHGTPPSAIGSLDFTLTGDTANVHQTLLQKRNGDFYLMLWKETSSYNTSGTTAEGDLSTSGSVSLHLNGNFASASVYGLNSPNPLETIGDPRTISLSGTTAISDGMTIIKIVPGELDQPWASDDVGTVGIVGTAQNAAGTFTLNGAGADIFGSADELQFVHQNLNGNGEIIARVASMENTHQYAKVGLMLRESLAPGSRNAFIGVTPALGTLFQSRVTTSATTAGAWSSGAAPTYLRLVRSGDTVTGYRGTSAAGPWTQVGTNTITGLSSNLMIGLAVCSHDDAQLNETIFDNVTLTPAPRVTIVANDPSAQEWVTAGRNAQFTITRTGSTASSLTVSYSIGGTAGDTADYAHLAGTVTIPAGSASAVVDIVPVGDSSIEGDESVVLTLTDAAAYNLGMKFSDSAVIVDDAPDLIVTNVTWSNANPVAGDALSFTATIKNQGTRPVPVGAPVRFRLDDSSANDIWYTVHSSYLEAGESRTFTTATSWTAEAGNRLLRVMVDNSEGAYNMESNGVILESDERNNLLQRVIRVASQRVTNNFQTATGLGGWTSASGNTWQISDHGGKKLLENTDTAAGSSTNYRYVTRALGTSTDTYDTSWSAEFDYAWQWGGSGGNGNYSLFTYLDMLDATGSGYRLKIHQGTSGNSANAGKLLELFKVIGNVQASTSLATGGGYNAVGWKTAGAATPVLRKIRLTFDRASNTLRAFADTDNDGALNQVISVKDSAYVNFTQARFGAGGFAASETPGFDNIFLDELL